MGPAEATTTPGISKRPSIVRKAHTGPVVLTVEKLGGLARLQRRVREMHELSMTLERVEPLQRGVAEDPVPNRRPKG